MVKLISWNVNGVRAMVKKGAMTQIIEQNPDIFCIQEIKAKPEQIPSDLLNWQGYNPFICSAERPGYSGVATFSRMNPLKTSYGLGIARFDIEGRVLINEFADFTVFNCYYPNGGGSKERLQYKMDFYDDMLAWAKEYKKPLVICGDVNTAHQAIDLARPKENEKSTGFLPMEREWIDKLIAAGFVDTFRLFNQTGENYSWWDMKTRARDRNIGWRIDYFFVSEDLIPRVKAAHILPNILGSDHCPVTLELNF